MKPRFSSGGLLRWHLRGLGLGVERFLSHPRQRRRLDDDRRVGRRDRLRGPASFGRRLRFDHLGREPLDRRDLGDDRGHRGALLVDLVAHAAGGADADPRALLRLDRRGRPACAAPAPARAPARLDRAARTGSTICDLLLLGLRLPLRARLCLPGPGARRRRPSRGTPRARSARRPPRRPRSRAARGAPPRRAPPSPRRRVISVTSRMPTTSIVVAASAAPTAPMKLAATSPSHWP